MIKQGLIVLCIAAAALTGGIYSQHLSAANDNSQKPMPEFTLPDLNGKQRSSSEWQGKILVINFWATWCPPCRKEIPEFIALQEQLDPKGVQFIGIAIEEKQPVDEFLTFVDINYPTLIAGDLGRDFSAPFGNKIGAIPYTVVVNRQGDIVEQHSGKLSRPQLLKLLAPLL